MSYTDFKLAAFGPSEAGLATVGYQLFNPDSSQAGLRITAGVEEFAPGTYGATITFPSDFSGELRWDTGGGTPTYLSEAINDGGVVQTVAAADTTIRSVNFRDDVLYGMAHLLGVDPTQDLLLNHARAWCAFINRHVRSAFNFWDWPELRVTEERAFRQVWNADASYLESSAGGEPDEVYYAADSSYYRVIDGAADPPAGTLPTDGTYWELLDPIDRFIPFDQPGKQSIGKIVGIYSATPRTSPGGSSWSYSPSERGIDVPWTAGPTVWISYQVREPKFTVTPYDNAAAYERHALVYDVASGRVYRCILPNTGASLTSAYWLEQVMPYVISEYVKLAAAADAADDAILKVDLATQARKALEDEVDKLTEQGEVHHYSQRGPCRMPLGLSGFYWSVAAPY